MGTRIRAAQLTDADDLGRVHVRAWQAAYRNGLMPDEYLDGLSEDERSSMWRDALQNAPRSRSSRLVASIEDDSRVVGFALVGPAGGELDAEHGELFAINVDPDYWGTGAGSALLAAATDALKDAGFSVAVLWVHPSNGRACAFYEARGWRSDEIRREQDVLGVTVPELRYSISL